MSIKDSWWLPRSVEDGQGGDASLLDPSGQYFDFGSIREADAPCAGVARVEMSRSLGRLFSFVVQYRDLGGLGVAAVWRVWGEIVVSAYRLRISLRRLGFTAPGTD